MALNGLICAEVPLRTYSLTHSFTSACWNYSVWFASDSC